MNGYQLISYFLTNELRLLFGLLIVAQLQAIALDKRAYPAALLGGVLVSAVQVAWGPSLAVLAVEIVVLLVIAWTYLREQVRMSLFFIFFYEAGTALGEFLLSAWLGVWLQQPRFLAADSAEALLSLWLARALTATLLLWLRSSTQAAPAKVVSLLAVLGLVGTVSLSQQTTIPFDDDQLTGWIIVSLILMFALMLYRLNRQHEADLEIARLKQEQAEILERDYQALRRTYADNAQLYHDLHNHIEAIYQCLLQQDWALAAQYCQDLRGPVRDIAQTSWSGDKAVDYLISSKIARAEQLNVQTRVQIEFPRNTNIRSVDLTTILGNLLDNALEAAQTAADELRFLRLTIRRINEMLIIKVENGCLAPPIPAEGSWQTTKPDKALHGWGLRSVRATAERYEGTLETSFSAGVFQAVVTLSFYPIQRP